MFKEDYYYYYYLYFLSSCRKFHTDTDEIIEVFSTT